MHARNARTTSPCPILVFSLHKQDMRLIELVVWFCGDILQKTHSAHPAITYRSVLVVTERFNME